MIQDLGDGLRMLGAGAAIVGASVLGLTLGLIITVAITCLALACVPACIAYCGIDLVCNLRGDMPAE